MINTQAVIRLFVTPQRTAESRFVAPTPIVVPVMVCVVLTGIFRNSVRYNVKAPAVSALLQWRYFSDFSAYRLYNLPPAGHGSKRDGRETEKCNPVRQIIYAIASHSQPLRIDGYHGGSYNIHYFLRVIQSMSYTEQGRRYKLQLLKPKFSCTGTCAATNIEYQQSETESNHHSYQRSPKDESRNL